ncbi:DUF6036 family nucleotidyltransferase [Ruania alba]|uniref:DUF6036 domain-containing protein n=1 Tax=Ruania alba TaxID=648782 RepID=A0A1H5LYY6_9MICO|nr:DUF6036 family nucleotidyltransferase [Ruania alba]SEE81478.1 hypothetical protein SAMN04488554_3024 [Ruania alba]
MATRAQLEHAIRAATEIIQQSSVLVIGSQSILGTWGEDELPPDATISIEFDVCPLDDDDADSLATRLDGVAGEWSPFHELHGFYVQGVGRQTAILPTGWSDRLVRVDNANTNGRTGLCLEPHDLCVAKLLAGRTKDHRFVGALVSAGLVERHVIAERLQDAPRAEARARDLALDFLGSTTPPPRSR